MSGAGRVPRRYHGKDINWWHDQLGMYEKSVNQLASPRAKFASKPHISGNAGGHTLNLHQFASDGVTLLGRILGAEDAVLKIAGDLHTVHSTAMDIQFSDAVSQTIQVSTSSGSRGCTRPNRVCCSAFPKMPRTSLRT